MLPKSNITNNLVTKSSESTNQLKAIVHDSAESSHNNDNGERDSFDGHNNCDKDVDDNDDDNDNGGDDGGNNNNQWDSEIADVQSVRVVAISASQVYSTPTTTPAKKTIYANGSDNGNEHNMHSKKSMLLLSILKNNQNN